MDDIMNITSFTTEVPSWTGMWSTPDEDEDEDYSDYENWMCDRESVRTFRRWYEPPLFAAIMLVGGVGNLTVVWIYLNFRRRLKTMSDVYLLNLAAADLLFLVTLPMWAIEALYGWNSGPTLCRLVSALYRVNLFSGTLLLTCISVDRYIVIVQTTKAQNSQAERRRRSTLVCAGVWLFAFALATPELVFAAPADVDTLQFCRMVYPSHVGNLTTVLVLSLQVTVGFCIPMLVMAFCYSVIISKLLRTRNFQKHKAMRVILVVVLVFVVSQLPYNSIQVMKAVRVSNDTEQDCDAMKRLDVTENVFKSIAYLHACLNPFLYAFVGERFRRDVLTLLLRCRRRSPAPGKSSLTSRSPLNSVRNSVMSDSDTSHGLSL